MDADSKQTCQNCGYYLQHYIWNRRYQYVHCGHCIHPPRTRHCHPTMKACAKWIPQDEAYLTNHVPET